MLAVLEPNRPATADNVDGPPPTTAVPLIKPVHPEPGYGQVSTVTPLPTNLHPDRLCKVAWGILLSRYSGAEQVAFGHVQAPSPPLDPKLPANSLTVCGLRLDPGVKLASALGHPISTSDHPLHNQEWPVQVSDQGQLNTVLVSYASLSPTQSRERNPSGLDPNHRSSISVEQASLAMLATMTRAVLVIAWQVVTGSLDVRLAFDRTQVAEAVVQELGHQFSIVVRALAETMVHPKQLAHLTIADVAWVDGIERQRLLQFAGTISHPDAVNTPAHLLVGEWASRTPDGIALDHEGRTVTYAEFDRMTSALAQMLTRDHGARPEVRIALLLPKSIEFIIALFAVLKSGAAYVPIDPEYPEERIRYIVQDSAVTLALVHSMSQALLGDFTCPALRVDDQTQSMSATNGVGAPSVAHRPQSTDLAYIVYTSGTTGQPKGVMVEHGNLANFATDLTYADDYGPGKRDLLVLSLGFDGILWSLLRTLCRGGTVVIPGADLLADLQSVHSAIVTPSFAARLNPAQYPQLACLILAGEHVTPDLHAKWCGHCKLVNVYGPTETTVTSNTLVLADPNYISVGPPSVNYLCYIVDENLRLVPVGAPGQLLIGGLSVARGYCNLPDLTAQKFIANPFGPGRVYLTGDRARWLSNGHVDLLGRMDHQIKLRGFRIELEEVEAAATSFPAVQLAVASVQSNCLALFVEPQSVDTVALLDHLRSRLARFMVPDRVVPVARLLLTANGKVDRKALPVATEFLPETVPAKSQSLTDLELRLREAWAQILQLPGDRIGITDDFFRIGGDSISAILLVSKCRQLGYKATVPLIYECRQLRALAARLTPLATAASEENQHQVQGRVDLTPIQHWFYGLPFHNPHHFNQSFTLRVDPSVTLEQIGRALVQLTNHHDILRARFRLSGASAWEQYIPTTESTPSHIPVAEATLNEVDYADFIFKIQSSLHLTDGPIMAACLIHSHKEPGCSRLFWTIHHALVDLISWRVLIEDLQTLLTGGQLPPKTLSFQTWCSQLDDYARTLTADAWPVQSMTVDNRQLLPPPEALDPVPAAARLSISHEFDREFTTRLLLQLAPQWRVTPRDMLLATFARAYCQALGTTQVSFVMEGHGREPWSGAMDVSRTVGWFTALYPLVLDVPLGSSVLAILHHTKEAMQQIPVRGFPYSLLRHMPGADPTERAKLLAKTPERLDVQFNYFGRFGNAGAGGADSGAVGIEWDDRFGLHDFAPDEHVIFDLNPMPLVNQDRLRLVMEYNPRVYGTQWAEKLINLWRQDLEHLAATPTASVQPLLTRFDAPLLQPTAQEFDTLLADLEERGIASSDVAAILPCTPMQGGLLVATLQDPSAYLVQAAVSFSGNVDLDRLQQAWVNLTRRHSVLRTVFIPTAAPRGNGFAQVVLQHAPLAWRLAEAPLPSLTDYFNENRALGFDMAKPMVRVHVSPTERPNEYLQVITMHHALVDGWSIPLLLRDLCQLYTSPEMSTGENIPSFCQVVEQVVTQKEEVARVFWAEYLDGVRPTPAPMLAVEPTGDHGSALYHCPLAVSKPALLQTAQRFGVTLSTLLRATYALVLGHYLDRDDLAIGFVVSGRNLDIAGIANVVGPCLNTVPVRFRLTDRPLGAWLQQLQADATRMIPYEHTSLVKVNGWGSHTSTSPLFRAIGGFENFPQASLQGGEVAMDLMQLHEFTEYPLSVNFVDEPGTVGVKCYYERMFCGEADIARLVQLISSVLSTLTGASDNATVSEVSLGHSDPVPRSPGRYLTADGVQIPLAALDRYLAGKGLDSPYSVVTCDGRAVTRTAAAEAECDSLRALLLGFSLPSTLVPAAIISLDSFPHLSGADDGEFIRLAEACLIVSDGEDQIAPVDSVDRWVAVTCIDLLLGVGLEAKVTEDVWACVLAKPSLLLQMEYRISQRFGTSLSIRSILACDNWPALARQITPPTAPLALKPDPADQAARASLVVLRTASATPYQTQVWLACELSEDPSQFHHQARLRLPDQVTQSDLKCILDRFMDKVEWLRTTVRKEEGRLLTHVLGPGHPHLKAPAATGFLALRCDELEGNSNLLVSMDLLTVAYRPEPPKLIVRAHPILAPHALFNQLTYELQLAIGAKHEGRGYAISPSLTQAYAVAPNPGMSDQPARAYWEALLADSPTDLGLPPSHPRPRVPTFDSTSVRFDLDPGAIDGLTPLVKDYQALPVPWAALVGSYLMRISGAEGVLVDMLLNRGLQCEGLDSPALAHASCPVRVQGPVGVSTLSDLSTTLSQQLRRSLGYLTPDYDPYTALVRPPTYSRWHPVRVGVQVDFAEPGVYHQSCVALWHDLIVRLDLTGRQPAMTLQYNPDLFRSTTIQRLGNNLLYYCQVARTGSRSLSLAPLVCPAEERLLLDQFGRNPGKYDPSRAISISALTLFRDSVQHSPSAMALESRIETVTYAEMHARIHHLARALQGHSVQPQERVAVIVESCPATVMTMLALWLIRAVYVPVDRNLPAERQRYMVKAAKCTHVLNLTDAEVTWTEALPGLRLLRAEIGPSPEPFAYQPYPEDLAYIIFTSGTTGQPKGVMIRHTGLTNLLLAPEAALCSTPGSRLLQVMAVGFDSFILVALSPLCTSSTLVFSDGDIPAALRRADSVLMTPSVLGSLSPTDYPNLRRITTAGEPLPVELAAKWLPYCRVQNQYGPTEITVCSHAWEVEPGRPVTIGRPVTGSECFIVDRFDRLVPIGVVGEICVGGLGVSAGYVNRPDLNDAKFVRLPYSDGLVYRTGDLGRWLPSGEVESLGRRDDQVKLRGFRIELAEVRGAILSLPGVQDAHVLVHERSLVAFICPHQLDEQSISSALRRVLPAYMVPNHSLGLDRIPCTTNGKADRPALLALFTEYLRTLQRSAQGESHGQVQGDALLVLWAAVANVLGLPRDPTIGHLSFFKLGGDSISAIQVSARCRQSGYRLPVPALLKNQPLSEVATAVEPLGRMIKSELAPIPYGVSFPLTSIQSWFFAQGLQNVNRFDQSFLLELTRPVSRDTLETALLLLVNHHPVLRTRFSHDPDEQWSQSIPDPFTSLDHQVHEATCTEQGLPQLCCQVQQAIDIHHGRNVSAALVHLDPRADGSGPAPSLLFLTIHHLVVDLVSWSILLEDLASLLNGQVPPPPRLHFASWATELARWRQTVTATTLDPEPALADRPWSMLHNSASLVANVAAGEISYTVQVPTEVSESLIQAADDSFRLDELLLAAVCGALAKVTQSPTTTVHTESHGRHPWHEGLDLSRTVGWFTTILPVTVTGPPSGDLRGYLRQVKYAKRGLPFHGLETGWSTTPLTSNPKLTPSYCPMGVVFNFLGRTTGDYALTGQGRAPWVVRHDLVGHIPTCDPGELRPHVLEVLGRQTNTSLELTVNYCPKVVPTATVAALGDQLVKCLVEVATLDLTGLWVPSDFPLLEASLSDMAKIVADLPTLGLTVAEVENLYPMTPMQQGLWTATAKDPTEYLLQSAMTIDGVSDSDVLLHALEAVVARHSILRTVFLTSFSNARSNGIQVVSRRPRFGWRAIGCWSEVGVQDEEEYLRSDKALGFTPDQPLLRYCVAPATRASTRLIMTIHHALIDGWSFGILTQELRLFLSSGPSASLSPAVDFSSYVEHIRNLDDTEARTVWEDYLRGIEQPTTLLLPKAPTPSSIKTEYYVVIHDDAAHLQALVQDCGLTVYTLLKASWAYLLHRYTGQSDIVFGNTVSGRVLDLPGVEGMFGCLISTIPLRIQIDAGALISDFLQGINEQSQRLVTVEHCHLAQLDRWVESSVPVTDLFNTLLVYENYPDTQIDNQTNAVTFSDFRAIESTEYAMTVITQVEHGQLTAILNWDGVTFAGPYVEALGQHLRSVFAQLVDCLREGDRGVATLSSLQLLSPSELQAVTDVLARPTAAVNCDVCVHDLVAQQVLRTPDTDAVEYDDPDRGLIGWTYQELFDRATQVAGHLLSQGVHREEPVGLLIRRHPTLVVGMVAILQAGGAFVPLDADLPLDRLRLIVQDCGMRHILSNVTDAALVTSIGGLPRVQVHDIEAMMYSSSTNQSPVPLPQVSPANLSHIIYTSGTTGRPKGVPIEHHTVASYLQLSERVHGVAPGTRFMQNMALGFDCLILEVLTTLAQGGTLVVRTELLDTLPRVEAVMITPSVLAMLDPGKYPNLQQIITAGEALPTLLAQRWARHCRVLNLYGPAEAFATHSIQLGPDDQVTVGNPIPNTECYVLDAELRPVPFGVMGEICFGGPCVTRGYLNRPELNRTQFVPNPLTGKGRLYRSGDLGRWLLDGTVEYIARKDDQVKVRGYRVELTEVEAVILRNPEVESAAAVLLDGKLYAFVTPQGVPVSQVRAFTAARLPAYMVPTATFALDQLPLSHNGKADRRHLKKLVPALLVREGGSTTQRPRNNAERHVVAAMAQTLNLSAAEIDIHDSFFQLGGDSISAIRLSSLCRDHGIYVSIAQIFQYGTPAALAGVMDFDRSPSVTMAYQPFELVTSSGVVIEELTAEVATSLGVETGAIEDVLPVSSLQQGFLVSTLKDPSAYMVQMVYDLTGPFDVATLHQSWSQVVRSHQILRTKFLVPTDQSQHAFLQVVLRDTDFEWTYHDQPLTSLDQAEHHHLAADRGRGFTLTGPLLRFAVYRGPAGRHLFCTTFHHALLDAWSESIVMAESLQYYHGVKTQPRPQYHEFIRHLTHIDQEGMAAFWRDNLDGVKLHPTIQFPRESNAKPTEHGEISHPVSTSLLAIKQFCRGMGLTVNSLLRAVWALTLARYLGEKEEVTLGVLVSGRNVPVPGIEGMVGMCINTLPLRVRVDRNHTITDFLHQVNADSGALTAYEQCSLVDIKRWAKLDADGDLFNSLLVYDNYETTTSARTDQINYVPRSGQNVTEYAYTANFYDQDDTLMLNLSYQTRYCNPSYAHYLVHFIDHCLAAIVSGHTGTLGNLMILPAAEQALIRQWSNGTTVDFPQKDWLAHQFFTQHLATRADAIALESATDQFTYAEVYHRACAIAAALHSQGARCGDRVALLFTRCPEFIFSYLAVLLLGGVCVPMDAKNAPDRLLYMVDLLEDPWVVTHSTTGDLAAELGLTQERVIYADRALTIPTQEPEVQHPIEHTPGSLAYIVFTSGTTGQPKGVQVTHRSLANSILAFSERLQLLPDCRFLQMSNLSFDALLLEMFCAFHAGGTLVFQDGELFDDLHRITACLLVPSVLATLDADSYPELVTLIAGGEVLPTAVAERWAGRVHLHNFYGPSEATIASHSKLIRPRDMVTIGMTLANIQCHILDDQLHAMPIGRPGELCIGGEAVSRGYWGRPELTDQAFVANPFGAGQLYRTGDLGCWLANGEVQVLGRKDFQVKLRGFRIELSEIESTCQAFPGVANAVALVKDKCLAVYVSPTGVKVEALKEHIAAKLPHYMVPEVVVSMEALPLTSIGKVDRRALQALPLPQEPDLDGCDDLPISKTFTTLRHALIETLNVDPARVVPSASFLRLGGDSISAIQFFSRCKKYGLKLTVADILKHPKLARLEQCAQPILDTSESKPQMDPSGPISPTAVMHQVIPSMRYVNHFNQSSLLSCRSPPTLATFKEAIRALVVHHDILRLRLTDVDGKSSMAVLPLPEDTSTDAFLARFASITEESLLLDDYDDWVLRTQQSINVEHGPVLACSLLTVDAQSYVYLTVHHLCIDFVSWRIMLEDLETLLQGQMLQPKTLPFREWAMLVNDYAPTLADDLWPDHGPVSTIPIDIQPVPADPVTYRTVQSVGRNLGLKLSQILYEQAAPRVDTSPQEFMVASLVMALTTTFQLDSLEVQMEGHGRQPWRSDLDVSRTLGWFTAIYPVAFHPGQSEHYASLPQVLRPLAHVKQRLHSIPDSGFPYGLLKYLKGRNHSQSTNDKSLTQPTGVVFNYSGRFNQLEASDAFWSPAVLGNGWSHALSLDEVVQHALSASCDYDGKHGLTLTLDYSTMMYHESTANTITNLWLDNFQQFIQAALSSPLPCHTASDYGLTRLSEPAFGQVVHEMLPNSGLSLANLDDLYPCLPIQEGLLLATLNDPAAYMVLLIYTVQGPLDPVRLQEAWATTAQQHAIFRTQFLLGLPDTPFANLQLVRKHPDARWLVADWSDLDPELAQAEYLRLEREQGFDLKQIPIRFGLFHLAPDHHRLIVSVHHAILDGWSGGLFTNALLLNYAGQVVPPAGQVKELVAHIQAGDTTQTERFWAAQLDGIESPSLLVDPYCVPDLTVKSSDAAYYGSLARTLELGEKIVDYAQSYGVTVSTFFRAVVALVLHRHTGSEHPVFGTVVSGRNVAVAQVESTIGPCISTIPCRARIGRALTVGDLLQTLHHDGTAAYDFEHCRLTDIHRWSGMSPEQPLFNVLLAYQNYPEVQSGTDLPIRLSLLDSHDPTDVPLTLKAAHQGTQLYVKAGFQTGVFSTGYVERFMGHLETTIRSLVTTAPSDPVSSLSMLTEAEHELLTNTWARNPTNLPTDSYAHEGFLSCVHSRPGRVAIRDGEREYTYGQLHLMATHLAHRLHQTGKGRPDQVVGILAGNSVELIVGQLAVWMAGSAFVVIAPDYPVERQQFILADAACVAVVGPPALLAAFKAGTPTPQLAIDLSSLQSDHAVGHMSQTEIDAGSLAYVIYTSGTTGTPKGVMHEHGAAAKSLQGVIRTTGMTADVVTPTLLTPTFDVSLSEIWTTLSIGGRLLITLGDQKRALQQATRAACTPSLVSLFEPSDFPSLNSLVLAGEPSSRALVDKWSTSLRLFNWYGPTEVANGTHCAELKPGATVTVGRPLPNAVGLILDEHLRPSPVGIIGQLYLGGKGLARSYLNRPELTAEKFITWPVTGERLYQSGDLGRWLPDGQVECLGRIDHQVKVRGFRVELGEVEAVLESHPTVTQACVLVQDTHLVGYVCPALSGDSEAVLDWLRSCLPHYMVPSALVGLAELPRTPVGKVDRKALPPFHFNCSPTDTDLSTLSPVESQLLQTVADCLRLDASAIRLDSTFYQIGGNSLSAIQVVAQCQRNGLHLAIADLNRNNTLRQVARLCAAVDETSTVSTRPDQEVIGCPRLTPGQLAFFSMPFTNPNQVALPVLFKSGRTFPEGQWRTAVRRMVELHPMLRGLFRRDDQMGTMTYDVGERPLHDHYRFELHPVKDFATVMSMLPSLLLELDFERGPLSTFHVFDLGHEQYFFHCVHHLASDYLSYKVFAEDLTRLLLDQQVEPPTVSCQAWAEYLHQEAQVLDLDALTVPPPLPDLAVSLRGEVVMPESTPGGRNPECLVGLDLSPSTLTSTANRFGATPIELLVTALHVAYQEVFRFNVMGLAFMTHGRQSVGDTAFDLSRTVGFFAHYVPVVLDAPRAAGFRTTLRHTQETLGTGIEDGVKLTLVRYLRDFTGPTQRRPYEIDPFFGFSYLAPTEASVPADGNQPLLQELTDIMAELRDHRVDTSPRLFELAVTHEGDRLDLLVIGQRNKGIPPMMQRLLGVWSETLRQMVATPDPM